MPPVKRGPWVIGIVGSRRRDTRADYLLTEEEFKTLYRPGDKIVSGGCPKGGDRFAERIAREYGLEITIYHANWSGPHGKKAGFIRNTFIAEDCDVLIACVAPDRKGGTEDTIKKVMALGKKVVLVKQKDDSHAAG